MKKLIALLLALASFAGILSGCRKQISNDAYVPTGDAILMEGEDPESLELEEEEQSLTLAYDPSRSMNPLIGNNLSNRVLFSLTYQGLFAVDSRNNPTPILCGSFQVDADNKRYTYYLDPRATFSDGSRVTPEDVLATYEAARKSDYYGGRFIHVYQIDIVEGGGIRFILNVAYEDFSMLLDIPILKASEIEADFPLGSGPYTFTQSSAGAFMTKVPNWWCNQEIAAKAEVITLVEVKNQTELRDQFEFGDVSLACTNPLSDSYSDFRCDYELWDVESGYFLYLACNVWYSDFFKDDDTLQKALTYAIDREWLIDENYRGLAYPATLPMSPGSPYYVHSLAERYEYDSQKFLNAISGWEPPEDDDGNPIKMKILVNCDDSARLRTARDIAAALTELGVPAGTLEYSDNTPTTLGQVLRAGTYDIYLGQTRLSANMDLTHFYGPYGNLSHGGMPDIEIYALCQESLANKGIYYNLQQKAAEDGRLIPVLFGYHAVYAKRGVFENLAPSRDNVFYYSIGKTMGDIQIETVYN